MNVLQVDSGHNDFIWHHVAFDAVAVLEDQARTCSYACGDFYLSAKKVLSLTRPLTTLLSTHSLTHSSTQSLIYSFIQSVTHRFSVDGKFREVLEFFAFKQIRQHSQRLIRQPCEGQEVVINSLSFQCLQKCFRIRFSLTVGWMKKQSKEID